ncbi:DUF3455 domain-containing protein [Achromobacter piechaudii]|uniref:Tat pathway signal sequence domain protein n=1 Tax=Achromobacter piechaudii ATCC 43553 TaxID=742159 RepID=D4XAV7_9BURK|nr:DUF3455 domain-containing protein [Achromobacter piechaudii]EFF76036.1 hypothetical protein HMPREF0004_2604 [Achromobacter piechaudii ATCC 43553]
MAKTGNKKLRFPPRARIASAASVLLACMTASTTLLAAQTVPPILQVPADNAVVWRAPATGTITYECSITRTDGVQPRWVAVKAEAVLGDGKGGNSGSYSSPPETWKASDGSALTGMVLVRANVETDRLYDQLVLANPARGVGLLTGVTYIQRLVSSGGAAPQAERCTTATVNQRVLVDYRAEYVFWKPQ